MSLLRALLCGLTLIVSAHAEGARRALVIQTDFGTKDGAVAAMKGVAVGVEVTLPIFDLSHENTPYDIWEAAYRLKQTASYWPAGTVFVSVVDPGVGTERASVVVKTQSGHYFVGPDNGTWTFIAEDLGIESVRRIDEMSNRRAGSEKSYTFHGRDIYAYTGARLAAGKISYEQVGPLLAADVIRIPYEKASRRDAVLKGTIPQIDFHYGNIWTNIPDTLFSELKPQFGDTFSVTLFHHGKKVYHGTMPYTATFGAVPEGQPLLYLNSLLDVAFALNLGNFAKTHHINSGSDWSVEIERAK
jgi:S-adenosylmethionine hydrolase